MSGIFVNYRREDSAGWTGRLSHALRSNFDPQHVFVDIATLEPGIDYTEAIEHKLESVDILLAVIGPRWLTATDKRGQRRLDAPNDLVRMEISAALRRNVRVVPVLVGGATMPAAEDLPDDLQGLVRRNSYDLSDTRWDYDQEQFITFLSTLMPSSKKPKIEKAQAIGRKSLAIAAAVALAVISGGLYVMNVETQPASPTTTASNSSINTQSSPELESTTNQINKIATALSSLRIINIKNSLPNPYTLKEIYICSGPKFVRVASPDGNILPRSLSYGEEIKSKPINIGNNCHVDIWFLASKGFSIGGRTGIISPVNLCSGNVIISVPSLDYGGGSRSIPCDDS